MFRWFFEIFAKADDVKTKPNCKLCNTISLLFLAERRQPATDSHSKIALTTNLNIIRWTEDEYSFETQWILWSFRQWEWVNACYRFKFVQERLNIVWIVILTNLTDITDDLWKSFWKSVLCGRRWKFFPFPYSIHRYSVEHENFYAVTWIHLHT